MIVVNDLLDYNNLKIYQDTEMFNFSLDSVLLANFVTINKSVKKILDIGTGNAPIPLILTTKTNSKIDAIELQKKSYELAKKSIEYNKLDSRIHLINDDINIYYNSINSDTYDVITCNPPFFKIEDSSKKNLSEAKKIARHEFTLKLENIFIISKKILKNNGRIAIVHRPERMIEIIELMKENGIEPKRLQFVYPKENLDAKMILIEGVKSGKKGLKVLSPIYVHNEDGSYTKTILDLMK
jgi:tRNA1(Val) A37 N6-methylase TrmN6